MKKPTKVIIQKTSNDTITLEIDGKLQNIQNQLTALQAALESQQTQSFQSAEKIYNIGSIDQANFDFVVRQAGRENVLPERLSQNLITDENRWALSLRQELIDLGISVNKRPSDIFQNYGWLIEEFLRKMETPIGRERSLRRLSFMAEAYQSSLRYLSFIQFAQLLKLKPPGQWHPDIIQFTQMDSQQHLKFDYLNLLLVTSKQICQDLAFMPQIHDLTKELLDTQSSLYGTVLFLKDHRNMLLDGSITRIEEQDNLLDKYLTGLLFWLRKISFLAKYRLVSIKDISLKYQLGTTKNFIHLYGELHGVYDQVFADDEDPNVLEKEIQGQFTYNQSILLFQGNNVESCLDNISDESSYVSLSPLIIDLSVYLKRDTQTPQIYYYAGCEADQYCFAQYNNELIVGDSGKNKSNKFEWVRIQNNQQPELDQLHKQVTRLFDSFKSSS
ncbi:MAG: hypothetical protein HRU41_14960 [Saprospiraceae bacterium]|nr:hypothetical protein [Saprospiraceae bacterium]